MELEVWKNVCGYEGLYEVSDRGIVKSHKYGKERILRAVLNSSGYKHVSLSKNGISRTLVIHKIVSTAFMENVENGKRVVIDHINGVKTDNRVSNLRYVSQRFNLTTGIRKDRNHATSIYPGVCWHKRGKKWIANIVIRGKLKHLGYYPTEIEASYAYQKALSNII